MTFLTPIPFGTRFYALSRRTWPTATSRQPPCFHVPFRHGPRSRPSSHDRSWTRRRARSLSGHRPITAHHQEHSGWTHRSCRNSCHDGTGGCSITTDGRTGRCEFPAATLRHRHPHGTILCRCAGPLDQDSRYAQDYAGVAGAGKMGRSPGRGKNHRFSLGDGVLIKDNHLAVLGSKGVDVAAACRLARAAAPHGLRIEVEAKTLQEVKEALAGKADIILLDNMSPALVRKAVNLIRKRALVEVSGGMTLQTVKDMAQAGADFISVGALTHSAPAANLSLDLSLQRGRRGRTR